MSGDLTRWNRAALSRFRYIDGNAATYLETLRQQLVQRFGQWTTIQSDPPLDETVAERLLRLVNQYNADRRDWGWETTRSFARALHVLTEHLDAFTNEGYLRTATQLSSLHALAAMIGYTPAPASSATTSLVLNAKASVSVATVARGFAVKASPPGQPPVIFETLEDIDIAPSLNVVHLANWNQNATPVTLAGLAASGFWQSPGNLKLSAGGVAILASSASGSMVPFAKVTVQAVGDGFAISAPSSLPSPTPTHDTVSLYVAPAQVLVPALNGAGTVWVSPGHGLAVGDIIFWTAGTTQMAMVTEADDTALRLHTANNAALPASGVSLYRALLIGYPQYVANSYQWRLPSSTYNSSVFVTWRDGSGNLVAPTAVTSLASGSGSPTPGYYVLNPTTLSGAAAIWVANPAGANVATTVASGGMPSSNALQFKGAPSNLASGDPVLLQNGGNFTPNTIVSIEKDSGFFRLTLAVNNIVASGVTAVHAAFAPPLRPRDAGFNPSPVIGSAFSFALDIADWPAPLTGGRTLVLESASGAFDPLAVRVVSIDPPEDGNLVHIDQTLPQAFTIGGLAQTTLAVATGDLLIRANVPNAGHGQTKPTKTLGSGDASQTSQTFTIDTPNVSQVRDITIPGGIRSDLIVQVGDEFYTQVANLGDSDPADPSFTITTTESGPLILTFGDGRHGRRLQSGTNNVRVTLRQGSGLSGNLAAGTLTDIVKKHPAVDSFEQPAAAIGGADAEALADIRVNAPGRLVAMDRAISVSDYQQLAQRFLGVWHALAYEQIDLGRSREGVAVVIVPAGGGPLGTLAGDIQAYLTANGLPSVDVTIVNYDPVPAEIAVTVRVDFSEYDPRDVAARVRTALLAAFDLSLRAPAQPFYRSEVYRVVTGIEGVANCDVALFKSLGLFDPPGCKTTRGGDHSVWAVYPDNTHVVYAANPAKITIATAEATT